MATIAGLYSFGDIVGFVQDEINSTDSAIADKIKRWVNRYLLYLNRTRHRVFNQAYTFQTVNGTALYTISGTATITSGSITVGNVLAVKFLRRRKGGGWDAGLLRERSLDWLYERMPDPEGNAADYKGKPVIYSFRTLTSAFNPQFYLYHVPDEARVVEGIFTQRLPVMSAASATNIVTLNYPEILIHAGAYGGWKQVPDLEKAAIARAELEAALRVFHDDESGETSEEGFREDTIPDGRGYFRPLEEDY